VDSNRLEGIEAELQLPLWQLEARLGDVIPRLKLERRLGHPDLDRDWFAQEVAGRPDGEVSGSDRKARPGSLVDLDWLNLLTGDAGGDEEKL
jgi:hypothetical protein